MHLVCWTQNLPGQKKLDKPVLVIRDLYLVDHKSTGCYSSVHYFSCNQYWRHFDIEVSYCIKGVDCKHVFGCYYDNVD